LIAKIRALSDRAIRCFGVTELRQLPLEVGNPAGRFSLLLASTDRYFQHWSGLRYMLPPSASIWRGTCRTTRPRSCCACVAKSTSRDLQASEARQWSDGCDPDACPDRLFVYDPEQQA
jgi:hypothetical protein